MTSDATGDSLSFVGLLFIGGELLPAAEPKPATFRAGAGRQCAEYGKYVASYGDCRSCHGPDMTGTPASRLWRAVPNPRPLVATIERDQFRDDDAHRRPPRRRSLPGHDALAHAAAMNDEDLAALYAYLTTAP